DADDAVVVRGRRIGEVPLRAGRFDRHEPYFVVAMPPSTGMIAPVMYDDARELRKIAVPAMSSGRPMRRSGVACTMLSPAASSVAGRMRDWNGPGGMAFTVISGARCFARWRVRWCTAAFDAAYA